MISAGISNEAVRLVASSFLQANEAVAKARANPGDTDARNEALGYLVAALVRALDAEMEHQRQADAWAERGMAADDPRKATPEGRAEAYRRLVFDD